MPSAQVRRVRWDAVGGFLRCRQEGWIRLSHSLSGFPAGNSRLPPAQCYLLAVSSPKNLSAFLSK